MLFCTTYYSGDGSKLIFELNKGLFQDCSALADCCRLTNDRSLIEQSAAVLFYMPDFIVDDLPSFRSPKQRWIFFTWESPRLTGKNEELDYKIDPLLF